MPPMPSMFSALMTKLRVGNVRGAQSAAMAMAVGLAHPGMPTLGSAAGRAGKDDRVGRRRRTARPSTCGRPSPSRQPIRPAPTATCRRPPPSRSPRDELLAAPAAEPGDPHGARALHGAVRDHEGRSPHRRAPQLGAARRRSLLQSRQARLLRRHRVLSRASTASWRRPGCTGSPAVNAVWRNASIEDDPVTQSNTARHGDVRDERQEQPHDAVLHQPRRQREPRRRWASHRSAAFASSTC